MSLIIPLIAYLVTVNTANVGSWDSWMTGYHVNEKHDGYLDIGEASFNIDNLNLSYMANTQCSNEVSLFANNRIYCVSDNVALSYFPQNGSLAFWYVTIASECIVSPTFTQNGLTSSFIAYSRCSSDTTPNLYVFDSLSGDLKYKTSTSGAWASLYVVGTQHGYAYFGSKYAPPSSYTAIRALDTGSGKWQSSASMYRGYTATQSITICNNTVIITDASAATFAFTAAPELKYIWGIRYNANYYSQDVSHPAVCMKTNEGYKVLVRNNSQCLITPLEDPKNRSAITCGTLPILHYDEKTGNIDIMIMGTGVDNQIIALEMNGTYPDKELWFDNGNVTTGFIIKDYFVTAWKEGFVYLKIYDVYTGKMVWNTEFYNVNSTDTLSLFGGLTQDEDSNDVRLMIGLRIGETLYAYKS